MTQNRSHNRFAHVGASPADSTRDVRARSAERDNGLLRLKRLTGAAAVTVTALAGLFAGLAAQSSAGRKAVRASLRPATVRPRTPASSRRAAPVPPPPPLPALGSDSSSSSTPPPAAPAQPPAASSTPPVATSGGS